MSKDLGNPIVEVGASAADFADPVYPPLPNSPVLSADVAAAEEVMTRRTRHLFNDATHVEPQALATVDSLTATSASATDMLHVSVVGAEVGDWVTWTARALVATVNVAGTLSMTLVEDATGTPATVTPGGCTQPFGANVTDQLAVITGQYEVATAGQLNVFLLGAVSAAGGGNQLSINTGARLDVVHIRPIR